MRIGGRLNFLLSLVLALEFLVELLSELSYFRCDYHAAIALVGMLGIVIQVVILGAVEVSKGFHLRNHFVCPDVRGIDLLDHLNRIFALLLVAIEDYGTILVAFIVALSIQGSWVANRHHYFQQILEGDYRRIESDVNRFCMPGVTGANVLIARVFQFAARVARHHLLYALKLLEDGLHAPETSGRNGCRLVFWLDPGRGAASGLLGMRGAYNVEQADRSQRQCGGACP
jgi:hypothetical protein